MYNRIHVWSNSPSWCRIDYGDVKMTKNLSNIERALQDIKGDIEKWERIYKQLISIDGIDVMVYQTHEKVTELESLQFILKSQLSKMGGK